MVGNDIVAHSLRRIVRDNEIPHLEAADFIPLVLDEVLTALAQERETERMCRHGGMEGRGSVDRFLEFLAI